MTTDEILSDLVVAQRAVEEAQLAVTRAQADRDRLVVLARKTGTPTSEIASLIGVNRARAYQILDRAGLTYGEE